MKKFKKSKPDNQLSNFEKLPTDIKKEISNHLLISDIGAIQKTSTRNYIDFDQIQKDRINKVKKSMLLLASKLDIDTDEQNWLQQLSVKINTNLIPNFSDEKKPWVKELFSVIINDDHKQLAKLISQLKDNIELKKINFRVIYLLEDTYNLKPTELITLLLFIDNQQLKNLLYKELEPTLADLNQTYLSFKLILACNQVEKIKNIINGNNENLTEKSRSLIVFGIHYKNKVFIDQGIRLREKHQISVPVPSDFLRTISKYELGFALEFGEYEIFTHLLSSMSSTEILNACLYVVNFLLEDTRVLFYRPRFLALLNLCKDIIITKQSNNDHSKTEISLSIIFKFITHTHQLIDPNNLISHNVVGCHFYQNYKKRQIQFEQFFKLTEFLSKNRQHFTFSQVKETYQAIASLLNTTEYCISDSNLVSELKTARTHIEAFSYFCWALADISKFAPPEKILTAKTRHAYEKNLGEKLLRVLSEIMDLSAEDKLHYINYIVSDLNNLHTSETLNFFHAACDKLIDFLIFNKRTPTPEFRQAGFEVLMQQSNFKVANQLLSSLITKEIDKFTEANKGKNLPAINKTIAALNKLKQKITESISNETAPSFTEAIENAFLTITEAKNSVQFSSQFLQNFELLKLIHENQKQQQETNINLNENQNQLK